MSDEEGQLIEEIVEDVWDCSSCGKKDIRGRELNCPGCNNGREQTEAYRDGDGAVVTDPAMLALATSGANWACAYCDMDNRGAEAKCQRCGADKEVKQAPEPPPPTATPEQSVALVSAVLDRGGPSIVQQLFDRAMDLVRFGGIAFVVLVVFVLGARLWATRTRTGTVAKVAWSRYVYVEKRVDQIEEAWDQAPPDGKVIESRVIPDGGGYRTEITGYRDDVRRWTEKVADGQEPYTVMEQVSDGAETYFVPERVPDGYRTVTRSVREQTGTKKEFVRTERLGNGFSKKIYREVPVYGSKTVEEREPAYRTVQVARTRPRYKTVPVTKYRARFKDVERTEPIKVPITRQVPIPRTKVKFSHAVWVDSGTRQARGQQDEPAWPEVKLAGEPEPERERARTSVFEVTLKDGSDELSYMPKSVEEFKRFTVGATKKFKFEGGVHILD